MRPFITVKFKKNGNSSCEEKKLSAITHLYFGKALYYLETEKSEPALRER